MNADIKKIWVEALRSGQYKQGQTLLRNKENKFCCLGVLCNLHAQAHPAIAAKQKNPNKYLKEGGVLPRAVMKWAGLPDECGAQVEINGITDYLTAHNDGVKLYGDSIKSSTFKQIAKAIEKQL
jgi:hypothetical protein